MAAAILDDHIVAKRDVNSSTFYYRFEVVALDRIFDTRNELENAETEVIRCINTRRVVRLYNDKKMNVNRSRSNSRSI